MGDETSTSPTIWTALDAWAKGLKAWQRRILVLATEHRHLSEKDIDEVYEIFLGTSDLKKVQPPPEIPFNVSGRPADPLPEPLRLDRVDCLSGVNALPENSALAFCPSLTVIFGRNGAGKSGFGRLFANTCFSRQKPPIISNIYDTKAPSTWSASFHVTVGGQAQQPYAFKSGADFPELKRISVFDVASAHQRLSQAATFEFRPVGFDIFPEMARVYGEIGRRLDAECLARTHATNFSESFIGNETDVSKAVAVINAKTDLEAIKSLGTYGATEKARLEAIDQQLIALKSSSPKDVVVQLRQAKSDVETLRSKLDLLGLEFTSAKRDSRNEITRKAKESAAAAALVGTETFKRSFFNAVGTPEWETFVKAAHALGKKESADYPQEKAPCLLCERPFDEESRKHVAALMAFVEGDAQRQATADAIALSSADSSLKALDVDVFNIESRVREHVHRIDPAIETVIQEGITALNSARALSIAALASRTAANAVVDTSPMVSKLIDLESRIGADITRLEKEDAAAAIAALELERQAIRHREVLSQLLPSIVTYVTDAAWCAKAASAKSGVNPKHITEKEKELFSHVIGETYRRRLEEECKKLNCILPIELHTMGQKGQTVRSLSMKGGYRPDTILSEGEQKAIALADFLTEVSLNPANAGIVLDDPVTSQDHDRKLRIAQRLVEEAARRQVIVFTHDVVFLNELLVCADRQKVEPHAHWIDRHPDGKPGRIVLHDSPSTSKHYDTTERAKQFLTKAKGLAGSEQLDAIRSGMAALRRTVEEAVAKLLLKGVVPRWSDRVIVTGLRRVKWEEALVEELCTIYEDLSQFIEGHSHTDEAAGAPPQVVDLETRIAAVDALIRRAKADWQKAPKAAKAPVATPIQSTVPSAGTQIQK